MAFYDGLGKRIQQSGQGAIDRTKKNAEVARLNSSISALEKEMSSDYEELGRIFYQKYAASGSPDPDMAPNFQELDGKMAQLEVYKEQIRSRKGIRKCPVCGQDISADAMFCSYCGTRQEPVIAETVQPTEKICANCGTVLEEDAVFCPRCGQQYVSPAAVYGQETVIYEQETQCGENEPEMPQPDAAPEFEPDPEFEEAMEPDVEIVTEAFLVCPACGAKLDPDAEFCTECGQKIEK